jgi:hypothetical protein
VVVACPGAAYPRAPRLRRFERTCLLSQPDVSSAPAVRDDDAISFAKSTAAPWWPPEKLDQFPKPYGRVDEAATRYWSLWVDRDDGKLYAEHGDW